MLLDDVEWSFSEIRHIFRFKVHKVIKVLEKKFSDKFKTKFKKKIYYYRIKSQLLWLVIC